EENAMPQQRPSRQPTSSHGMPNEITIHASHPCLITTQGGTVTDGIVGVAPPNLGLTQRVGFGANPGSATALHSHRQLQAAAGSTVEAVAGGTTLAAHLSSGKEPVADALYRVESSARSPAATTCSIARVFKIGKRTSRVSVDFGTRSARFQ